MTTLWPQWTHEEWAAFLVAVGLVGLMLGGFSFLHARLFGDVPVARKLQSSSFVPVLRDDWLIENDLAQYCRRCDYVLLVDVDGRCSRCGKSNRWIVESSSGFEVKVRS